MSEKRGSTAKLIYDFETSCCEVKLSNEIWYRVTAREFRSFDGERRLISYNNSNEPIHTPYTGPVYLYKTNLVVARKNSNQVRFEADTDPRQNQQSTSRFY